MQVEMAIICQDRIDRGIVSEIRQEIGSSDLREVIQEPIQQLPGLSAGLEFLRQSPDSRVLVLWDFDPAKRNSLNQNLRRQIVSLPPAQATRLGIDAIREVVLRTFVFTFADVRPLRTQAEFAEYLKLRYEVWGEEKYPVHPNPPDKAEFEAKMELDYRDNYALPFGVFLRHNAQNGNGSCMIGCARLILGGGPDNAVAVSLIKQVIAATGSRSLPERFVKPLSMQNPYDLLDSFPEFDNFYHWLKRDETEEAEVSRVIVRKEYRRHRIGVVLMQYVAEQAKNRGIDLLLLACKQMHQVFYEKCGFQIIPGLSCDRFANVSVPAIAMKRGLTR